MRSTLSVLLAGAALLASSQLTQAQTVLPLFNDRAQTVSVQPQFQEPAVADEDAQLDARFQRQIVNYDTREAAGTIIIDTPNTYLYLVLGNGQAMRYGIGVGRDGFTWAGVQKIARKAEWPDWYPPSEMIERQPYLPRMTAGGPGNPLGARAMYLGSSVYRIHGTNDPTTIGKQVSSGCIRLTNEDVSDLYSRVNVGTKVIVLPQTVQAKRTLPTTVAAARDPEISSYAPQQPSRAQSTWASIRPAGLY